MTIKLNKQFTPPGVRLAKHLLGAIFGAVSVCPGVSAVTLEASAVVDVPLPDLQLYAKGGYPDTDNHSGFNRMILMPNGSNPGVGGYANVVVNTNQGPFSVRLPLCKDAAQATCWDNPSYWVEVPTFDGQSVTGGTNPVITGFSVTGYLQNLTAKQQTIQVKIKASDENGWGAATTGFSTIGHATLPAAPVCSLNVNPSAGFGKVGIGQTAPAIQITSDAIGDGHITFKPDAYDDNGGILQGDNGNRLNYTVVNSASAIADWNATQAWWSGDESDDYSVLLDRIPASTGPGEYQGTLLVTLSCD